MSQHPSKIPPSYYYSASPQSLRTQRHTPTPKRHGGRVLLFTLPLLVIGALLLIGKSALSQDPKSTPASTAKVTAPEPPVVNTRPTISADEMRSRIQAIIAANPDVEMSISVKNMHSDEQYQFGLNPTIVYEAASVAKLITASYYLHLTEDGSQKLSTVMSNGKTAQANLELMIVNSDNDAWHVLNDELTRPKLTEYGASIGFSEYTAELNRVTPTEIALLLDKLYHGKLLNKAHTTMLLGYMKRANRTDFIKSAIPDSATFYHKAGWVEDRAHDAAIIESKESAYVLVIFTNGHAKAHTTDRSTIIQQITKASYAHFISSEADV